MTVIDELTRRGNRARKARAKDHVVESPLEQLEQLDAGIALAAQGFAEELAQLCLGQPVVQAQLLLLLQAASKLGVFAPPLAVLTRRVGPALARLG
jgi:hypothetical protein